MRKLIAVCLALTAMSALGALGAGSASAAAGEIDFACVQNTPCTYHGLQKTQTQIRINAGTIKCTGVTWLGGSSAAEGGTKVLTESGAEDWAIHTLKLRPTHTGCTFNGLAATMTTTGCFYNLTMTSKTAGTITFGCEAGKKIVVEVPAAACTITTEAQTPINNAMEFTSEEEGGKKDILITDKVGTEIPVKGAKSGIRYTSSGGACGESGENGSARGSITIKAYKSGEITAANQIAGTIVETLASGQIK